MQVVRTRFVSHRTACLRDDEQGGGVVDGAVPMHHRRDASAESDTCEGRRARARDAQRAAADGEGGEHLGEPRPRLCAGELGCDDAAHERVAAVRFRCCEPLTAAPGARSCCRDDRRLADRVEHGRDHRPIAFDEREGEARPRHPVREVGCAVDGVEVPARCGAV